MSFSSRTGSKDKFSFLTHPFILTPSTKSVGLFYDNRVRMISERRASIYHALFQGGGTNPHPYLKLSINRNNVVPDAMLAVRNYDYIHIIYLWPFILYLENMLLVSCERFTHRLGYITMLSH